VKTEIQTGVTDGEWIEVTNHRAPGTVAGSDTSEGWRPFTGTEKFILGDLSILNEGQDVKVETPAATTSVAAADAPVR
jgi:hypothetical protein